MAEVKGYKFEKSDRNLDNKNNTQLKEIIVQIQSKLRDLENRIKNLENN